MTTVCEVCRGGTSVTFDVTGLGGDLAIARDVGKPRERIYTVGGTDSGRELPRAADNWSAGDRLVVVGRLDGPSAYSDAQTLAEELVKPQQGPTDDPLQLGIEFAASGQLFGAEVGVPDAEALTLEYRPGRKHLVEVRLVVDIVSCLNLAGAVDLEQQMVPRTWAHDNTVSNRVLGIAGYPRLANIVAVASVNGKLYATGGFGATGGTTTDAWMYDPTEDEWSSIAPIPTAIVNTPAVGYDGRAYYPANDGVLYIYDPTTDAWSSVTRPTSRERIATAIVDGALYTIGGRTSSGTDTTRVDKYDISTDTWSQVASLNSVRSNIPPAITYNDQIYVFGGWDGNSFQSDGEVYDPAADSWTASISSPPFGAPLYPGWCDAIGTTTDRIYVTSGSQYNDSQFMGEYDPTTDSWIATYGPRERPVRFIGGAQIGDVIYSVAGRFTESVGSQIEDQEGNRVNAFLME